MRKIQPQLKVSEGDMKRAVKDYLRWQGWFCCHIQQGMGSYKGIPDIYAIKGGRSLWIEGKTAQGRQSEHQLQFEDEIKAHGGEYLVARSVDDVMEYLRE